MNKNDDRIVKFFQRLDDLSAGERARFKRNVGKSLAESHDVLGLFFRVLPHGVSERDEPWFFQVATLFPFAGSAEKGSFGTTLRSARSEDNGDALDRRMEILLAADEEQLAFRLRQAVNFVASQDLTVNWPQLLSDLTYWSHRDRFVQKRWARAYFTS